MCGIAGILAHDALAVQRALPPLLGALAHRGPDDRGQDVAALGSHLLGFGHTRLSIIDLSAAGHQPMVHPTTGDRLIFNGEIYNFPVLKAQLEREGARFVGHSDSEVLLHALVTWGAACLPRLQGMYAFAFHARRAQRLLLARDPLGIKPLYLARQAGGLIFASEVRAILATELVSRDLDRQAVAGLLAYGAVPGPRTIFRAIEELPPGSALTVTVDGGPLQERRERFWRPPARRSDLAGRDAVAAVRDAVEAAVRNHLISDVPVGVFLSSGLDSTIVAGVTARHAPGARSFTVGFSDAPDLSEAALASDTARRFGLQHTRIDITMRDAETAMPAWLAALDQPSLDGFNTFLISRAVRAQGIKVALSGQGGDELFGGYPTFADVPRLLRWFRAARFLPRAVREALATAATRGRAPAVRAKAADIATSDGTLLSLYLMRRRAMANAQLRALGLTSEALGLDDDYLTPDAVGDDRLDTSDPVASISRLETRFYLGNMLLRDGDANGMSHGLEIRVPLLDQRLVDLAMALPGAVLLPQGRANKHLLREAFPELLRPALLEQRKRGFTLPVGQWMRGSLRPLCEEGLAAAKRGGLDGRGVDGAWTAFLADPDGRAWSRVFTLIVLGLYLRAHGAVA